MKTSKNKISIIILAFLISGLFNFISTNSFAASGPVSVSISANFNNVNKGEKSTLTWNSINADGCVVHSNIQSPWYGIRSISGNETITPTETATYFITCSNSSGFSETTQTKVFVGEFQTSNVSVSLSANPESIFRGESTILIWNSTNAVSCEASGYWSGLKPTFGNERVSPSSTVYYTLRCNNSRGEYASDTQSIFVNPSGPTSIIPLSGQFNAACITNPARASVGQTIIFAGAQSYGTEPATYRWSGDVSGNTQAIRMSFPTVGTKTAQLIVTDATGKTASATCSAQVISGSSVQSATKILKLAVPTNLKPNGNEFSSDTEEVTLSWDSVRGAKFYAVRIEPEIKTDERDSKNNCPGNPHYLCLNNLDSTSIKVPVKSGNTYNWWVHAVDANGVFSNPAFAEFSVKAEEATRRNNLFANIFGGVSGWGLLFSLLLVIAFILGYIFGKRKRKSEASPANQFRLPPLPPRPPSL